MTRSAILAMVILSAAVAFGNTTMYSVEPLDMVNSAFVQYATEDFVAVADSVAEASVFIGSPQNSGTWDVRIEDMEGNWRVAHRDAASCTTCSFVRFVFPTPLGVRKGSKVTLKINHSNQGQGVKTEVFWNPNNPYPYGGMSLTGIEMHPPPETMPNLNCDLACRINGQKKVVDFARSEA